MREWLRMPLIDPALVAVVIGFYITIIALLFMAYYKKVDEDDVEY